MTTLQTIHKPATQRAPHPVKTNPPSPTTTNSLCLDNVSLDSTSTELSANSKDVIVGEQWLVLAKIGEGSFGEVFEARDIDIGRHYAIKRESRLIGVPQMKHESVMYDVLAAGPGIPQCHWYGQHEEFDCIVIDLLGPSLKQLRQIVTTMPLDIMVDLACQMVCILEHIHQRGLVFRDIKPDNFLFPASCQLPESEINRDHPTVECRDLLEQWRTTKLYVVDFGLATWWRNPTTYRAYPESKKKIRNKTGTARYASLNVHRGKTHARRDDIESLGYLILDLALGSLPWTGIQARNSKAGWDRMRALKEETLMSDLCAGLPRGFLEFVEYSRRLRYFDKPDYNHLRRLLRGSLDGGEFSQIVRSPFGGKTERQDLMTTHDVPKLGSQPRMRQMPCQTTSRRIDHTEDVFVMDDIVLELPSIDHKQNDNVYQRRRRNSHRRSSENGRHDHERSASSSSSVQRPVWKNRQQHAVGWNSHKRDRTSWAPKIEWDREEKGVATKSWGENKPDRLWYQET